MRLRLQVSQFGRDAERQNPKGREQVPSTIAKELTDEEHVAHVLDTAPRLSKVAAVTAISFGIGDGANRALLEQEAADDDLRQVARGNLGQCCIVDWSGSRCYWTAQIRSASRAFHRALSRSEVVKLLTDRAQRESPDGDIWPERAADAIRGSADRFCEAFSSIDWELHGRLQSFRNSGVAHLTPEGIKRRITYNELRNLVRLVVKLRECLMVFVSDQAPFYEDEIEEWSDRAKAVWDRVLRASGLNLPASLRLGCTGAISEAQRSALRRPA